MDTPFRYSTGEEVMPGDRVVSDDRLFGVVESVSLPGSEDAAGRGAPEGGIAVLENVRGVASCAFYSPADDRGTMKAYQIRFIQRGAAIKITCGGNPQWPYESGPFDGKTQQECEPPNPADRR